MSQTKAQLLDSAYESGAVLTGSTNNTIPTVTGAKAISGEANLTFDGTRLTLGTATSNASDVFTIVDPGNVFMSIRSDAQADGNNQVLDFGVGTGNRASGNVVSSIAGVVPSGATAGGTLKGYLSFSTNSGDSLTERLKITETGNVSISDGDLVIGTAGHGIDFSATSGTGTSELLDDYEEGTWTASCTYGTLSSSNTRYTRVGRLITCWGNVWNFSDASTNASVEIRGLPYDDVSNVCAGSAMMKYAGSNTSVVYQGGHPGVNFYGATTGNWVALKHSELSTSNSEIYFICTYECA